VNGFPRSNTVEANHSGAQRRDFAGVDSD
jgi:hypothetical protein